MERWALIGHGCAYTIGETFKDLSDNAEVAVDIETGKLATANMPADAPAASISTNYSVPKFVHTLNSAMLDMTIDTDAV